MMKRILLIIGIVLAAYALAFSQTSGTLKGRVTDKETGEPIPFASIVVESGGTMLNGGTSDFDGYFTIKPITPGSYDVKASYIGYKTFQVSGFIVGADKTVFQNFKLSPSAEMLDVVEIVEYKVPLIEKDNTTSGATITSEEVAKMPNRSANAVATTVGGVFSRDGERGSVRGTRPDATVMYVDGIRVIGSSSIPPSAIEQVSVILSGMPAQYGDVTGAVINVTTKGPSRIFGAGVELESSKFLDAYGYYRGGLNINGPLWIKNKGEKNERSILGFFIAGDFLYQEDGRRSAIGTWKATDATKDYLASNPLRPTSQGDGTYPNAAYITKSGMTLNDFTDDSERLAANISAKVDIKVSNTVNASIGGTFNYNKGRIFSTANSMYNSKNNGESTNYTYRVFGRLTQRFPTEKESTSLFKNFYYTLQVDYSKSHNQFESQNFGDDLFKYGYLGTFNTYSERSYEWGTDEASGFEGFLQNGFRDTLYTFNPGTENSDLSNYTSYIYDNLAAFQTEKIENQDQLQLLNGMVNGQGPNSIYGMWNPVGVPFNGYGYSEQGRWGASLSASLDIGNHAVKFGFQYDQRNYKSWNVNPTGLWSRMRELTNFHIQELDLTNPIPIVGTDTVNYNRKYDGSIQYAFDKNLREKLGLNTNGTDYIYIDSYDMSTGTVSYFDANGNTQTAHYDGDLYELDMFSADELLNNGNGYVGYYGYNYDGSDISGNPTLDDFFNKRDANGNYTRTMGAFEPVYMAGYIQDKFAFNDLIFNVGLRIDRFDANQYVLKDPYLLYPAYTAGDLNIWNGNAVSKPNNIDDDYSVYVDNASDPTAVVGYRDGDTWYDAAGIEITDPEILNMGSGVSPWLQDPNQREVGMSSFKDYDPDIKVMPRISFSFPISDEALFFAHYDILTLRPNNNRMDPTNYLFFDNRTLLSNPNLEPSQTIDYELGFKQVISSSSSLSIAAYYKEIRNEIQMFRYTGAYPRSYNSYNNIDFGTTKGLTLSYDLRRTNNARVRASYTLQFAEGTGSGENTQAGLIAAGLPNLRTVTPLNYDRRHQFNVLLDYRYASGKDYNGPVIERADKTPVQLLANTGVSFTLTGGSGTPYTRQANITSALSGGTRELEGTINGSRLPWQFRIDAKIDRDIYFKMGKNAEPGQADDRREIYLNVYVTVNNILDTKNVMGVWAATGDPDDDGYLASADWQTEIETQLDPYAYRQNYSIFIDRPGNYSSPRTIRLGVILNF